MPDAPALRLGIVDYANVAPLVAGLPGEAQRRAVPSQVADWLATGEVDAAIVPAIELGRMPGLVALPDWGIAADGRCESVLLFSRVPLPEVRSVSLDAASRTAATLTRIVLAREGAGQPVVRRHDDGDLAERLEDCDAALLIGDPAMRAEPGPGVTAFDLAVEWKRHVGLPFVFAVWASRAGRPLAPEERALLRRSAEEGLSRLPELARTEAERTGLSPERLEAYLGRLDYRLGQDHLRGLRAFLDEAFRIGVLPQRPEPAFYEDE